MTDLKTNIKNIVQSTVPQGAVSAAPLPTAPAGGFEQGGWYNARQYWDGTFSEPGQIHPKNPNGGGGMVSAEVNAATSAAAGKDPGANQTYINSLYSNPSGGAGNGASNSGSAGAAGVPTESQKAYDELNSSMNNKRAEADKRRSEVNENPFLSESSRVGRIAKIDSMLNDTLATDQIQLNNLEKRVAEEKAAAKPDYQIFESVDDAGNTIYTTIDKKSGKMVTQTNAGKVSKATKASSTGGGGETGTPTKATISAFNTDASAVDWSQETDSEGNVVNISPYMKLVIKYAPKMSLQQIHDLYLQSSLGKKYGEPKEDSALINQLYSQARGI
jgi:hypothetical protein